MEVDAGDSHGVCGVSKLSAESMELGGGTSVSIEGVKIAAVGAVRLCCRNAALVGVTVLFYPISRLDTHVAQSL